MGPPPVSSQALQTILITLTMLTVVDSATDTNNDTNTDDAKDIIIIWRCSSDDGYLLGVS